jgi:hypothetical protein
MLGSCTVELANGCRYSKMELAIFKHEILNYTCCLPVSTALIGRLVADVTVSFSNAGNFKWVPSIIY